MTAPMVDYKIHWLKMMSVPESRAVVGRHDGINGRDRDFVSGEGNVIVFTKNPHQGRYGFFPVIGSNGLSLLSG